MRRDSIFYQIFRQSPTLLFELLPQSPENADRYIFEAVEVKETAFRMDGVFLPPDSSGVVYFCEVQFQLDELLYERMASEIGIYIYRNRDRFIDWQAVVIYPSRSVEQLRTDTVREMLNSGRIQRIYLDELGEIDRLPIGLGLMILTTIEGDRATTQARRLIDRARGERAIIDLVSTIIIYKFSSLSRDEVNAMLGIELEQTRVYQEAKIEAAQGLVFRQLSRRVGNMPSELQNIVKSLPLEQLENLGETLLDFTSLTDLEAWLSQNDR